MFSKEIVGSDAFQDMPDSSQLLYFHLGMEADDDGFIGNPKKIARSIGMADDDMKILISKRFVLLFESGVLVIKHHRINNNWDKHNCKRTIYLEEFKQLFIKENKAYTRDKEQGKPLQSENSLKTVFRIEENRIEEKRESDASVVLPQKKTYSSFRDAARARIGNPPMGKKPMTTAQKRVMADLVKIQSLIDQYKTLAEKKGLSYLEFPEEMNTKLRRQFLNVIAKYGDGSNDFIDWIFTGGHKWAKQTQYNPESCLASFMFDAYKNKGVKEEETIEDTAKRLLDSARKRGNGDTDESDYRMWARTGMAKELGMADNDFFDSEEYKKVKHIIGD